MLTSATPARRNPFTGTLLDFESSCLRGVTSNIQDQLNAKLASTVVTSGTFTPTVFGWSTAGVATYYAPARIGKWVRVDNTLFYYFAVEISAHTGTGNLGLGGLPYNSANVTYQNHGGAISYVENLALTAGYVPVIFQESNYNGFSVGQIAVGGGGFSWVTLDTSFILRFSGHYFI